jgi:hypothetical protein
MIAVSSISYFLGWPVESAVGGFSPLKSEKCLINFNGLNGLTGQRAQLLCYSFSAFDDPGQHHLMLRADGFGILIGRPGKSL